MARAGAHVCDMLSMAKTRERQLTGVEWRCATCTTPTRPPVTGAVPGAHQPRPRRALDPRAKMFSTELFLDLRSPHVSENFSELNIEQLFLRE